LFAGVRQKHVGASETDLSNRQLFWFSIACFPGCNVKLTGNGSCLSEDKTRSRHVSLGSPERLLGDGESKNSPSYSMRNPGKGHCCICGLVSLEIERRCSFLFDFETSSVFDALPHQVEFNGMCDCGSDQERLNARLLDDSEKLNRKCCFSLERAEPMDGSGKGLKS
jgi:hypothetical protein